MFGLEKLGSLGAGANDRADPVILSKEELDRRRKLAQALMEKGSDTSPVQHWSQGAARLAQALDGAIADYQVQKADRDAQDAWKKAEAESGLFGAAPATPATPVPQATSSLAAPGNIPPVKEGDISKPFLDTLRGGGITNPNALAAIGATGARESGWSSAKAGQTWSDPSESGQAGTSGGALSWRADRLRALQNYARANGEQGNGSPETQAKFFMQEDPQLVARLNAAKTPEEAMQHMNNAWRFAGYDRPGGERDARMAEVSKWAGKVASNDPNFMPQRAALATPAAPAQEPQPTPAAPVQVAQASQQQGGVPSLAKLLALRNNPAFDRAPAGTQAVVNAMIQKAVTQEAKDPLDAEKKRLEIQNLRNSVGNADLDREGKRLGIEKQRRDLAPNEEMPLSAEDRAKFGIPEGQVAYRTRDGIKFGPSAKEDKLDRIDTGTEVVLTRNGKEISRVKKDLAGKEAAEEAGKSEGKLAAAAPSAIANAQRSIDAITEIEKHPNLNANWLGGALGAPGKVARAIPGTPAYGLGQRIEQIKGQTFLAAYDQLRGGGAITDAEGAKATSALARLDAAQSEADFRAALTDLKGILEAGQQRARAMGIKHGTVKDQPQSPPQGAPSAPQQNRTKSGVTWSVE